MRLGEAQPWRRPAPDPGAESKVTASAEEAAPAAALLDTRGIGRQLQQPPTFSGDSVVEADPRAGWVRALGPLTEAHRLHKARNLRRKARDRRLLFWNAGVSMREIRRDPKMRGKWYEDRARGQDFRVPNVLACGKGVKAIEVRCQACGQVSAPAPVTCGVSLMCLHCRGKQANLRRARVHRAREAVVKMGHRAGLTRKNRPGGRWTEKLITLTLPHDPSLDVKERIDLVFRKAWTRFRRLFKTWLETVDRDADQVRWYLAKEWTPGSDRKGHPHIHFWFWGPYLDRDVVRDLWREALEKSGFGELEIVGRKFRHVYDGDLIVDVKQVKPGPGGMYEVVKYIVKDKEGTNYIAPELFAQVYEALDGTRTQQGSKGFLQLGDFPVRCDCGERCFHVRMVDVKPVEVRERSERAKPAPS